MLARPTLPLFPQIFGEVFGIMKMVEKVGLANIFHDLGLQKRLESWKMLARPTISTFSTIFEEIFGIMKMVENVGQANVSTIFVVYKTFSEIRGKSGKSWPGHVFEA